MINLFFAKISREDIKALYTKVRLKLRRAKWWLINRDHYVDKEEFFRLEKLALKGRGGNNQENYSPTMSAFQYEKIQELKQAVIDQQRRILENAIASCTDTTSQKLWIKIEEEKVCPDCGIGNIQQGPRGGEQYHLICDHCEATFMSSPYAMQGATRILRYYQVGEKPIDDETCHDFYLTLLDLERSQPGVVAETPLFVFSDDTDEVPSYALVVKGKYSIDKDGVLFSSRPEGDKPYKIINEQPETTLVVSHTKIFGLESNLILEVYEIAEIEDSTIFNSDLN